jgi:hypothetical protein
MGVERKIMPKKDGARKRERKLDGCQRERHEQ